VSERRLDRKKMRYGLSVSIVERQCDTRKGEKRRQMKMITCIDDRLAHRVWLNKLTITLLLPTNV